jgi:hypothetical protein
MPRINGTTQHQTNFLRAFHTHQNGPPAELWPSPAIFRRWLRRPAFRSALESILAALRYQTDFHLAVAACHTARMIADGATLGEIENTPPKPDQLLRLHHLRQRFPASPAPTPQNTDAAQNEPTETPKSQLSEREWVRSLNGDKAVESYDRLVELRKKYKAQHPEQSRPRADPT